MSMLMSWFGSKVNKMEIEMELKTIKPHFGSTKDGTQERYTYDLKGNIDNTEIRLQVVVDETQPTIFLKILGKPVKASIGNKIRVDLGGKTKQGTL